MTVKKEMNRKWQMTSGNPDLPISWHVMDEPAKDRMNKGRREKKTNIITTFTLDTIEFFSSNKH